MSTQNVENFQLPGAGEWTFQNPQIAAHFDRHVREQLPWYDIATGLVAHVGRHYIPDGGAVVDIGASTGNVARALAPTLEARIKAAVKPGGAVVVFDKMAARGGHVGSVIYRMTLAAKYEAGALPEEIISKELSLAGVQRPMDEAELLGFEPVFRFGDFAGWLYERPAI